MKQLPEEIKCYILDNSLKFSNPAYIKTNEMGYIMEYGGELEWYGINDIHLNSNITHTNELFEGYLPFNHDIGEIPLIEVSEEIYADIYIYKAGNYYWVLFLDSSASGKFLKKYFQNRNEEKLFLDQYFNFGKDDSIYDLVRFLDLTILERVAPEKFKAFGKAPKWADFLAPGSSGGILQSRLINRYPFIENFLELADKYWNMNNRGMLKSDIWVETDEEGAELFLEAQAICIQNRKFLLIHQSAGAAEDKHFLIQKGRELSLEHELRIKAEKELKIKNRELRESNTTKDKFFSIIAHDLRNPIGGFRSVAELFSNHYEKMSSEEIKDIIRLIDEQSNKLFRLLENLLQWSRSQMGLIEYSPGLYDFKDLVDMVVTVFRVHAQEKDIILYNGMERNTLIKCDNDLIRIVLRNLVSNAIINTDKGGRVDIIMERANDFYVIKVQDTGRGLSGEEILKLFKIDENFQNRTASKEKGTGLGLILCKEFIELHGGRIWVESKPGKGSEFSFSIPV